MRKRGYHRQTRGPESNAINRVLKRHIAAKDAGLEVPSVPELAAALGIPRLAVDQRLSRIRRGVVVVLDNDEEAAACDCDASGPCLKHFKQQLKSESKQQGSTRG